MRPFDHHPSFFAGPRLQAVTKRISQLLGKLSQTQESQIELQLKELASRSIRIASDRAAQACHIVGGQPVLRLARSQHSVRSRPITA